MRTILFPLLPALLPALLLGSSAHATPEPQRFDTTFSAGDWLGSVLAGDAAGALGAFVGGSIGYSLAGECNEDPEDESWFGGCFLYGYGHAIAGAAIGSTFAGAGGIYAYGELSGHSGNYWAAAGGWVLGMITAVGVVAVAGEDNNALAWTALLTLPALGGTAGYVLTLDEGDTRVPTGGLIDVDAGVVRLGVPDVAVGLDREGQLDRVDVRLVGGRF